jgi:Flp pilus assembly protein TadG
MRIAITKFLNSSPRGVMTYIEFAYVAPLLFILIFGIINFAQLLYAYNFVSYSAQEASRWASTRGSQALTVAQGGPGPASASSIATFVSNEAVGLNTAKLVTTASWQCPASGCTANFNDPGNTVVVTVKYTYTWFMPAWVQPTAKTLSSTSEMVISN